MQAQEPPLCLLEPHPGITQAVPAGQGSALAALPVAQECEDGTWL